MATQQLRCRNCGTPLRPGIRYCEHCHEPVDAALVAELQDLYAALLRLDAWVRAGKGDYTIATLRDETAARYLELRLPARKPAVAVADTLEQPVAAAAPDTGRRPTSVSAAPAADTAGPSGSANLAAAAPVFAWRAFIAEQAIAIMAYLGGFLLLVATLSFEVGGWQVLDNAVKLAAVCAVYVLFAVLGVVLPRAASLRTVGRAYLGVFALMTPLVALAAYRFELRQRGFSAFGMLCLAAAYAALIYLALAVRTRFATYAYLGWSAALVAALAVVPWLAVDRAWWLPSLAVSSLALLLSGRLRRFGVMAAVAEPATQLSAVVSVVTGVVAEIFGLMTLGSTSSSYLSALVPPAVFALTAIALVPLAVQWRVTLRARMAVAAEHAMAASAGAEPLAGAEPAAGERTLRFLAGIVDGVDWLTAAFAAQAALSVAWWLGAGHVGMSLVLAGTALGELAVALALRRFQPARPVLRFGVEGLALALIVAAPALVWLDSAPNWPLNMALAAGLLVTACVALMETAPWWLLSSGVYLTLGFRTLLHSVLPANVITSPFWPYENLRTLSACVAGLALVVWLLALLLGARPASKRFAPPLYVVALGNALYASALLIGQPSAQQTIILTLFTLAVLIAGRREHMPVLANLLFAFFGALAVLPYVSSGTPGAEVALAAIVPALASLAVRRVLGRRWAYGPYAVGAWAALLAFWQLQQPAATTAGASLLGISFASWLLLLVAALAATAAYWEGSRWALAAPAAFALLAVAYVPDVAAQVTLVFALAGVGAGWRRLKGSWWGVAWHVAGLFASGVAGLRLLAMEPSLPGWALIVPLGFGAATYLVAAQEREPRVTPVAAAYAVIAIWQVPGAHPLVPTLVCTFALVALGVALRRGFGISWALAVYGAAVAGSIFAVFRVAPPNPGLLEALLLVFAGVAYAVAALERQPLAGIVPALYAGAAVAARPDSHALLPLALALGVLAVWVGRLAGPRWSWPLYAAAIVNAAAAAVLAQSDPRFEAIGLAAIAALTYVVAALESRPDLLPLAFLLGGLALASAAGALDWAEWQRIVAFAALGWVYYLGGAGWRRIPWLRERGGAWWAALDVNAAFVQRVRDVRFFGSQLHSWSGLTVAAGVCISAAVFTPGSFDVGAAATEATVVALLSCGGMLARHARTPHMHALWYAAGELLALAVTWQARALGADNVQAFMLAPASYQLVVGALLPADARLRRPVRLGQAFSLAGALALLLPTLAQSFLGETEWAYALVLAVEALVIAGVGVGTRSRLLVLVGSVFVGVAALRGAGLAVTSGVPVAVVIAGLALLLMGGATWLSLRARRSATPTA